MYHIYVHCLSIRFAYAISNLPPPHVVRESTISTGQLHRTDRMRFVRSQAERTRPLATHAGSGLAARLLLPFVHEVDLGASATEGTTTSQRVNAGSFFLRCIIFSSEYIHYVSYEYLLSAPSCVLLSEVEPELSNVYAYQVHRYNTCHLGIEVLSTPSYSVFSACALRFSLPMVHTVSR